MDWVEASGKSLPEAKEVVLDLLGVAEDDAEFVVLSEPKAGLFGRMRGEARVQARVRPVAPPPKRGRRPSRRREGGEGSRGGGSGQRNGSGGRSRGGRSNSQRSSSKDTDATLTESENGLSSTAGNGSKPSTTSGRSGQRKRSPRSGSGDQSGNKSMEQGKKGSGRKSGDTEDTMEESLTLEQQGEAAREFIAGLVQEFGLDAEVAFVELDEDTVQVAATGDDLGLLVGPRGATLAAVQDLARTFVQRQSENRTDRILVDVGGYREKRAAALRRFTEGIVHEVKASGEERSLEPMSPADRKVVHDTVNDIEGVATRSDGTEPTRYVVIQPAD